MWKQNKWRIIVSSLITLLPMLFGMVLLDKLPEQMTTHWGLDGAADGASSAIVAVLALPLILLAVYWLCLFFTMRFDKSNKEQNPKAYRMIFWIIPLISIFCNGLMYATAFGIKFDALRLMPLTFGFLFVLIGNYLPKCKQNFTLGIKVKWCLENEENWNATHRFGGKIWFFGGLVLLFMMFLPAKIMTVSCLFFLFAIVFAPVIYSYVYYKKQVAAGTYKITSSLPKHLEKSGKIISYIVLPIIFIFVIFIMFTGKITLSYQESSFTVKSSFWSSITVEYDSIDSVEYRDEFDKGTRVNGIGSARLLTGIFQNKEFGNYTLYSYTSCDAAVIIRANGKVLVVSAKDVQRTKAIYNTLFEKCYGGEQ